MDYIELKNGEKLSGYGCTVETNLNTSCGKQAVSSVTNQGRPVLFLCKDHKEKYKSGKIWHGIDVS
jgi:hypothetical protein